MKSLINFNIPPLYHLGKDKKKTLGVFNMKINEENNLKATQFTIIKISFFIVKFLKKQEFINKLFYQKKIDFG